MTAEALVASAVAVVWVFGGPALGASAQSPSSAPSSPPPPGAAECVGCHGNPTIVGSYDDQHPGLLVTEEQIQDSVHDDFTCVDCHSPLSASMHARLDAARESCATCHEQEAKLLAEGVHGEPERGEPLTCVSCHGNHEIRDTASETFHTQMSDQCAACHSQMGERFFGGNPFGMETHLGRADVAACWDCHGSHRMYSTDDPHSPTSEANILATCRTCHEGAPSNFADIQIHVANSPLPADPRLRAVTLYMLMLLIFVFGFFGYHTYLQITHERRRRAAGPAQPGGAE